MASFNTQPAAGEFVQVSKPEIVKVLPTSAAIVRFKLKDHTGTDLPGIPAKFAPVMNDGLAYFDISDYLAPYLDVSRRDRVNFGSPTSILSETDVFTDVEIEAADVAADGTVSGAVTSNEFFALNIEDHRRNANGTADVLVSTQKYFKTDPRGSASVLNLVHTGSPSSASIPAMTFGFKFKRFATPYTRISFVTDKSNNNNSDLHVRLYQSGTYVAYNVITLSGSQPTAISIETSGLSAVGTLGSGWLNPATGLTQLITPTFDYLDFVLADHPTVGSQTKAWVWRVYNPTKALKGDPTATDIACAEANRESRGKVFIYQNKYNVFETIILSVQDVQSIEREAENVALVVTDSHDAHTRGWGDYLATGSRRESVFTRARQTFTATHRHGFTREFFKAFAYDFMRSPQHYVVDVEGSEEYIRPITVLTDEIQVLEGTRSVEFSFDYQYADE